MKNYKQMLIDEFLYEARSRRATEELEKTLRKMRYCFKCEAVFLPDGNRRMCADCLEYKYGDKDHSNLE